MYFSVFRFLMNERSKYAINGVYKCENFEQHLLAGQFPDHSIGYVPWNSRLYITFKIQNEYNQIYPCIASRSKPKLKIRAFFNIKSKFWSMSYKTNDSIYLESNLGVSGPSIAIQDVLNEYLEDGALSVEYGFHLDAILILNDIWTFNLRSKLFNYEKDNNTATFRGRASDYVNTHYSPKQLLAIHSPLFAHESKNFILQCEADDYYAGQCLQIANGVRIQISDFNNHKWFVIAKIGRMMNLMNVVRYCDIMIIRTSPKLLKKKRYLKKAIKLNMRQCVTGMIELWDFEDLMEEVRKYSDKIPGEMMKVIVKRFISEEF